MTIHVCDRCHKKMTYKERDDQRYQIRHALGASPGFRWDHIWCDLCSRCSQELGEWLDHPKQTHIEDKGETEDEQI